MTINVDHVYQHGNISALCNCGDGSISDTYSLINNSISTDHFENIYTDDSTLTLNHNTFLNPMPQTANIFANTGNGSGGACRNQLTISNNLLAGGGYSIYPCGNATSQGTSTVSITGNRFARCGGGAEVQGGGGTWFCPGGADSAGYYPRAGSFGRLAAAIRTPSGLTTSGTTTGRRHTSLDARSSDETDIGIALWPCVRLYPPDPGHSRL